MLKKYRTETEENRDGYSKNTSCSRSQRQWQNTDHLRTSAGTGQSKNEVASFKCGPDYIDPMFHSRVIGTKSRNLDTFFTDAETTRYLLGKNAADCDIAVMEGVMGYYDGVGGISTKASAMTWQIPQILRSSLW